MLKMVRMALEAVLFFFILAAILAIASGETGMLENVLLAVLIAALLVAAAFVRRIGQGRSGAGA